MAKNKQNYSYEDVKERIRWAALFTDFWALWQI